MIARTLRTAAEWWRNGSYARRRAWTLRTESEAMLDRAVMLAAQSDALFAQATKHAPGSAERYRLEAEAHALSCKNLAHISKAGGDHMTYAMHMAAAAEWSRVAEQYDVRELQPVEGDAAHA
jgi:hypothetical protein